MTKPKPIKHAFTIILLVLSYTVGTMGLFTSCYTYYHRQAFQSAVRQAPASGLEKFSFTTVEFESINWFDNQQEFEWKGRMYDVSSISKTENGYTILCKNDTMEEMLLSWIHVTKNGRQQEARKGNPQPQFFNQAADLCTTRTLTHEMISQSVWRSFYHSVSPQTTSPPPRS